MKSRLREADCSQTAFVEAWGDLRPRASIRGESITANPARPELQIALGGYSKPVRNPRPSNQRLQPGARSQNAIQSP
jgi:hypothetical protein